MIKHSRSMVFGLAVLGLALVASPVLAANTFTINETDSLGIEGTKAFIPTFISMADPTGIGGTFTQGGIYIPYMGTLTTCTSFIGTNNGNCEGWASASITAWANGLYYDPRFGTPFIPPSGDHHRTGYRMLMQPSFSGGQWLSGFAPLNQRFPFMPEIGTVGAGGDVGLAMADASFEAGLNQILEMVDAHGESLTTGKFPRYWPHERAAWVDTLMVKYTLGGGTTDLDNFSQNLRSSVGFTRNLDVRWRAMSNLDGAFTAAGSDGAGCGASGWCEFYLIDGGTLGDFADLHLYVARNADSNTNTWDGTVSEITTVTKLDTISAISNGGLVLKTVALNDVEKLPTIVDDRMSQYSTETGVGAGEFEQQLLSQFRVYSGPNVHSEEGADPYAWVICGPRGPAYGEVDCEDIAEGGAVDSQLGGDPNGVVTAMVYNSNFQGQLADSALKRFGSDLNPARGADTRILNGNAGLTPDTAQNVDTYVVCTTLVALGSPVTVSGIVYTASDCASDPGADGFYGSVDDGTVFYKEAVENGLRGWIRESNGHAFSFLGADEDGLGGEGANFGLTTLMQQVDPAMGLLMSCLNCSPHDLPSNVNTVTYSFDWPTFPTIQAVPHAPVGITTIQVTP